MTATRERPGRYPIVEWLTAGPFLGVRDSVEPTTADPSYARAFRNIYRKPGPPGGPQVGRPGFRAMGAALGAVVQHPALTWTQETGTRQTVGVADGVVKVYDWVAGSWSVAITQANFATAGGAFSTTARVALVPFADKLVITDGVNRAFWWDGTPGAGGLTRLVNCPVIYGVPTVYYLKLAVIDAASRTDMYWSEEGDATIGYAAYNNAWTNVGGYDDLATRLVGTNEALYIFRARTALAVTGAMGVDFATAGTKANLSPDIGTISPWAVLDLTQGVFLVDADANPWLFHYGNQEPLALWRDCLETVKKTPRAALVNAAACYDEATGQVLLGLPGPSQTHPTQWLCFSADDLQYNGVWSWGRPAAGCAIVVDQNGVKRWSHSDLTGGVVSVHGTPTAGPWFDSVAGMVAAIAHEGTGPYLGYDPVNELTADLMDFAFTTAASVMRLGCSTDYGAAPLLPVTVGKGARGFVLDVSRLDVDTLGGTGIGGPASVGLAMRGHYFSHEFAHAVPGEPFGFTVCRARVAHVQRSATTP